MGEAERYPGIQRQPEKIKETKIIERMKIQCIRTTKQQKTWRNSDLIVAYIRYISQSDMVHPKINNLTYISRQGYQITETNSHVHFSKKCWATSASSSEILERPHADSICIAVFPLTVPTIHKKNNENVYKTSN